MLKLRSSQRTQWRCIERITAQSLLEFLLSFRISRILKSFYTFCTRKLVRLLGPCFKPGRSKENQDAAEAAPFRIVSTAGIRIPDRNPPKTPMETYIRIGRLWQTPSKTVNFLRLLFLDRSANRNSHQNYVHVEHFLWQARFAGRQSILNDGRNKCTTEKPRCQNAWKRPKPSPVIPANSPIRYWLFRPI